MELNEFSTKTGQSLNKFCRDVTQFLDAMNALYAAKRGDEQGSDYVPTRDDLVVRILERWRESGGFVGNGPTEQRQIIAELEALFAPVEPELDISKMVREVEIEAKRWKQLTTDIDDVLVTLTDENDTICSRNAANRLIIRLIERFINND